MIVGIYWVAHHNTFNYIKRSDRILLWLNLLLLLCIVFIPFPTALIGQYPEQQISVVIYGGTLVITGLALQLLWWYATSNYRLVDRDIDPQLVQSFILVPVYYIFPGRIDRHWILRPIHSIDDASGSDDGDAGLSGEETSPANRMSAEDR